MRFHNTAPAGLELGSTLPQFPKCWDCRPLSTSSKKNSPTTFPYCVPVCECSSTHLQSTKQSRLSSYHVHFEEQIQVARLSSRHFLLLGYLSNWKIGSHSFENDPQNVTLKPFPVQECGSVSQMSNHRAHKYIYFCNYSVTLGLVLFTITSKDCMSMSLSLIL